MCMWRSRFMLWHDTGLICIPCWFHTSKYSRPQNKVWKSDSSWIHPYSLLHWQFLLENNILGEISIMNEYNRLPVILSQNPSHLLSVRQGGGLIGGTYCILNLWFTLTWYLLINKYYFILYAFIRALHMIA